MWRLIHGEKKQIDTKKTNALLLYQIRWGGWIKLDWRINSWLWFLRAVTRMGMVFDSLSLSLIHKVLQYAWQTQQYPILRCHRHGTWTPRRAAVVSAVLRSYFPDKSSLRCTIAGHLKVGRIFPRSFYDNFVSLGYSSQNLHPITRSAAGSKLIRFNHTCVVKLRYDGAQLEGKKLPHFHLSSTHHPTRLWFIGFANYSPRWMRAQEYGCWWWPNEKCKHLNSRSSPVI